MTEAGGLAIVALRKRVETVLKKTEAFDESTAVDPEEVRINFRRVLELMERGGLIRRTSEGKIYLIEEEGRNR